MKRRIILIGILVVFLMLIGYLSTFHLKSIEVNGCVMSSSDEVKEKIMNNLKISNTVVMYIQNKIHPVNDIPFVVKYDINYKNKNDVVVTVYEKATAGCIEYMEKYIYIDKDGVVLETSDDRKKNVPYIEGLKITNWTLGKKLPAVNKAKFGTILEITQLINKYKVNIDGIEFTRYGELELQKGGVTIELGDGTNLPFQIMNLENILDEVDGENGVLDMKNYSSENLEISFKKYGE